LGGLDLYPSQ